MPSTSLALSLHDPEGRTASGIERLRDDLGDRFSSVAINATDETVSSVVDALAEVLPVALLTHAADEAHIGDRRRDAVEAALAFGSERILYSDADHLLRWVEARPDEVDAVLAAEEDLVVIGRSAAAMDASPRRLAETEMVINHIYELMYPGRDWDLLFALRLLSRAAAEVVVEQCREPTVANDLEWPLAVERAGLSVGYVAADGLSYRTIGDFDRDADRLDHSPLEWIRRVELAADHASVLRRFL